jgi:hypothetical protein
MNQSRGRVLLVAMLSMMLTQCGTMPTIQTKDVACESFKLIPFSGQNDSVKTVMHVREHNAVYRELCI